MKIAPDLFAERGDPWLTPREQAEEQAQLCPRLVPIRAKPKPIFVQPKVQPRVLSEHARLLRVQRENLKLALAACGGTRTILGNFPKR